MTLRPDKLLVSRNRSGQLDREEQLLVDVANMLGIPIETASAKMMERGRVDLAPGTMVGGSVSIVLNALRRLQIDAPEHLPYPASMEPWLHRKVWKEPNLWEVLRAVDQGKSLFVKPAQGWKRFTGFVVDPTNSYCFNGASKRAPVWVSEPIRFLSEWRAYVVNGDIRAIQFADHGGDRSKIPDREVITTAIATFVGTGQAPAGFAIDFGVTSNGDTALIEVNDGFSVGAYDGIAPDIYWEMTVARWFQLTKHKDIPNAIQN